jgi:hypothetical protein
MMPGNIQKGRAKADPDSQHLSAILPDTGTFRVDQAMPGQHAIQQRPLDAVKMMVDVQL